MDDGWTGNEFSIEFPLLLIANQNQPMATMHHEGWMVDGQEMNFPLSSPLLLIANQNQPIATMHHEGWMVDGQEQTFFTRF
jgi:hypothetical protein